VTKLSDFDYPLPPERVAQRPLPDRAASRLLLLERASERLEDRRFRELPQLLRGDELLVINNTRVIPARLFGRRCGVFAERHARPGRAPREFLSAEIEVLLLRQVDPDVWEVLVRPGRKMRVGERLIFGEGELEAEVIARGELGERQLRFAPPGMLRAALPRIGHVPLPPYIQRPDEPEDRERYQTVFARHDGAVAAPTAALHFTEEILAELRAKGIEICELTLHVGLGTFQPIHAEVLERHHMHAEEYEIPVATAQAIAQAKHDARPVLAVGTTVVRALEDAACKHGHVAAGRAKAELFIQPGHTFRVVEQLLTNFHLPRSTLLVLVAAFAGRERILRAYAHAVSSDYRFYSYGDCMLIR
jgi:S-adenosylmethionine:tRNA ribosyltransferase-isomerase